MNCLYCGKEINDKVTIDEKDYCWHSKCIKSFFEVKKMPKLDISAEQLNELVNTTVNKGLTVPGVQKKLSLHLSKDMDNRLTIVDYPTGYILKPQTEEFVFLPEYEDLAMRMADAAGIKTVPHALIKMNGTYAYITKRIDRDIEDGKTNLYAMEDFCQLSNRLTQDKYRGSYERCAKIIKKYSVYPGIDLSEFFIRVVFSFIIGNSDMHLKNFSLREIEPASRRFCLSKAYDMLPVNVIMPEDEEQLALTLNKKKRNIRKKDFFVFAESCDIDKNTAIRIIEQLSSLKNKFLDICDNSYLPEELKKQVKILVEQRIDILE